TGEPRAGAPPRRDADRRSVLRGRPSRAGRAVCVLRGGLMTAADFSQLVKGARRRADGKWWDAKCPAHEDTHASLSFADGDEGLIVKCHRGCPLEQVTAAAGCSVPDLFSRNGHGPGALDFTTLA